MCSDSKSERWNQEISMPDLDRYLADEEEWQVANHRGAGYAVRMQIAALGT
jgi:hypothetical protein